MRTFCRPDAFDVAVSLFTPFGYFEDPEEDRHVAMNAHRSLKAGGVLLLEMPAPKPTVILKPAHMTTRPRGLFSLQLYRKSNV